MKCSSCTQVVKPIVSIDIDGTLGDYHGHFHQFAQNYLGVSLPLPYEYDGTQRFWEYLGLELRVYREAKLAYRQGGMKRSMPVFRGASQLTHYLKLLNVEVWICTTRPFLRLDNIDPDTRAWLERNRIHYDYMLYGETKYEQLIESVDSDRIVGAVEDLPEQVEIACSLGIDAIMLERPYNAAARAGLMGYAHVSARSLSAAERILEGRVVQWRESHTR